MIKIYIKKKWTFEDIEYLKESYDFISVTQISKYLNRSVQAVYKKAQELNLKKKPPTEKKCKICDSTFEINIENFPASNNGKSFSNICRDCGRLPKEFQLIKIENRRIAEEKNSWIRSIDVQTYKCNKCNQEKKGAEMAINIKNKYVHKYCKECHRNRNKLEAFEIWKAKGKENNVDNDY